MSFGAGDIAIGYRTGDSGKFVLNPRDKLQLIKWQPADSVAVIGSDHTARFAQIDIRMSFGETLTRRRLASALE